MSSASVHTVAVLGLEGAFPFELGIPARVFGAADGRYDVRLCSVDGGAIRTNAGFDVLPAHGPELLESADTLIVCPRDESLLTPKLSAPVREALSRLRPSARVAAICNGGFVLAAAGLLDGRTATTHWESTRQFREWFPRVTLDEDVLFVQEGNIFTSAGAASGIDLCLHLIRTDHGASLANRAARRCVVSPYREGGQAQYVDRPIPDDPAESTSRTRQWILRNLGGPLSVRRMAEHARMAERTFARRFRAETGIPPATWVLRQRVAAARALLESTELSVELIANEVGFGTATSLRQHVKAELGVAPQAYRRSFRTS
jgi:transcriptional regulator GlxA family with amidase domain